MTQNLLSKALQLLKMNAEVFQISEIHKKTNGHIVIINVDNEPYKLSVENIDAVVVVKKEQHIKKAAPRFFGMNLN